VYLLASQIYPGLPNGVTRVYLLVTKVHLLVTKSTQRSTQVYPSLPKSTRVYFLVTQVFLLVTKVHLLVTKSTQRSTQVYPSLPKFTQIYPSLPFINSSLPFSNVVTRHYLLAIDFYFIVSTAHSSARPPFCLYQAGFVGIAMKW
jgi:hypothetical protein